MENNSSSCPVSDISTSTNRVRSSRKRELVRRQSYRLKRKMLKSNCQSQTADRSYLNTICVTRTVEWPATQRIGEGKSKLLFMLAISLNPKPGTTQNLPSIKLDKLDTSKELKARAKTRSRIFELYKKREFEELRERATQFLINAPSRTTYLKTFVEVVNLVSDDDDEVDQNDKTEAQAQPFAQITRQRGVLVNGSSSTCLDTMLGNYTSSSICYRKR